LVRQAFKQAFKQAFSNNNLGRIPAPRQQPPGAHTAKKFLENFGVFCGTLQVREMPETTSIRTITIDIMVNIWHGPELVLTP
jgi:hypothetical protein